MLTSVLANSTPTSTDSDSPPITYTQFPHELEYEDRPHPRLGERAIVDRKGTAGLLVKDGAVALMGSGGCGMQFSTNTVLTSNKLKVQCNLTLLKGATRLKGSLRSAERLTQVRLEGDQVDIVGGQTLVGQADGGHTFVEGKRIFVGRGAENIRLGDNSVRRIVLVADCIEIFGRVIINGRTEVSGTLTSNGSIAKNHFPAPSRSAPSFPKSPKEMSEEEDPEKNNDASVESSVANSLLPEG